MSSSIPHSVKSVAQVLGINPQTVRAWERRYGAVSPQRTLTGRRRYTSQEVTRLQKLLTLVNLGHGISSVAKLNDKQLDQLLAKPLARESIRVVEEDDLGGMLDALDHFRLDELAHTLEGLRISRSCRHFVLDVISPLMGKVGERVAKGKLSIAQEHALSAIVRDQISQIMSRLYRPYLSKKHNQMPTLIFATPEGDLHEFGILLGAALCANYGRAAHYLGPNLPAEALSFAVKALESDVVVLGNAPQEPHLDKSRLKNYLQDLHQGLPKEVEIWIGGAGEVPHLGTIFRKRSYRLLRSLADFDKLVGSSLS